MTYYKHDQILVSHEFMWRSWYVEAERSGLFLILHLPNVNFSGHKKRISEDPVDQGVNCTLSGRCLCKFDIPEHCMLAAYKTGNEIVSSGRPTARFLM